MRQRNRYKSYTLAIEQLLKEGLLYPCSCSRSDIKKAVSAPHIEDLPYLIYPGTCKIVKPNTGVKALRLDIDKAIMNLGNNKVYFYESGLSGVRSQEKRSIENETLLKVPPLFF